MVVHLTMGNVSKFAWLKGLADGATVRTAHSTTMEKHAQVEFFLTSLVVKN